ncbi:LicD family protein [Dysgonomonas sp. ZJ279]|uniref:LicD family protein n=1 Tax=Dysgonomonas sp. ZJ279 TaxID=2709796 RepID=UPI0013EA90A1|nr:LicD family protein [Dysgonomonas sp. ZJ279]
MVIYQILLPLKIGDRQSISIKGSAKPQVNYIEHSISINNNSKLRIDQNYHKNKYDFELSEDEILNFLTHRNAWGYFLDKDIAWCLVVESNVDLNISYDLLIETINDLENDWDLFFPYDPIEIQKKIANKKNGKNLLNINSQEFYKFHPYFMNFKWGNSIYAISKKGAEKLFSINTIEQRLDDTILSLVSDERLNIYQDNVDWFDFSQINNYDWTERCELILKKVSKTSSWNSASLNKARDILKVMSDIGVNKEIDLILQGGSHLGYIRHGGIMPWDDDIDIGVEERNVELFFSELCKNDQYAYGEFLELRTSKMYYKIWRKDGEYIDGYDYTFPFIDLWVYNIKNSDIVFRNGIICPNSAENSFLDVEFENCLFKIPFNSFEVLDSRYSDWRNFIHVYMWSHRLERKVRYFICIPIEVDSNGRSKFPLTFYNV